MATFNNFALIALTAGLAFTSSAFAQPTYTIGTESGVSHRISNPSDVAEVYSVVRNALALLGNGGTLKFAPGTYMFTDAILLPSASSFTLEGAGSDKTTLRLVDNASMASGKLGLLHGEVMSNVRFAGLTLDGNKAAQTTAFAKETRHGVYCVGCAGLSLEDVVMKDWVGNGFLSQPKNQNNTRDATITKSHATGNANGFVFISAANVKMVDSTAQSNSYDGVAFNGVTGASLQSVATYLNGRHGVLVSGASSNVELTNSSSLSDGHGTLNGAPLSGCGVFVKGSSLDPVRGVKIADSNLANSNMSAVIAQGTNDLHVSSSNLTGSVYCVKVSFTTGDVMNSLCNATKGVPPTDPTTPNFTYSGMTFATAGSSYPADAPPSLNGGVTPAPEPTPESPEASPAPGGSPAPSPSPAPTSGAAGVASGALSLAVAGLAALMVVA